MAGVTSLTEALAAWRAGNLLLARGVAFGLVTIVGAAAGVKASAHVGGAVLLAAFAVLMLLVGGIMAARQLRGGSTVAERPALDDPIITATVVGLLTGFLGVGGGF